MGVHVIVVEAIVQYEPEKEHGNAVDAEDVTVTWVVPVALLEVRVVPVPATRSRAVVELAAPPLMPTVGAAWTCPASA